MLGYMLGFMRQTKKIRNQAPGGIYLDDLNLEAHPELAALYIHQSSFRQGLQVSAASRCASVTQCCVMPCSTVYRGHLLPASNSGASAFLMCAIQFAIQLSDLHRV